MNYITESFYYETVPFYCGCSGEEFERLATAESPFELIQNFAWTRSEKSAELLSFSLCIGHKLKNAMYINGTKTTLWYENDNLCSIYTCSA